MTAYPIQNCGNGVIVHGVNIPSSVRKKIDSQFKPMLALLEGAADIEYAVGGKRQIMPVAKAVDYLKTTVEAPLAIVAGNNDKSDQLTYLLKAWLSLDIFERTLEDKSTPKNNSWYGPVPEPEKVLR